MAYIPIQSCAFPNDLEAAAKQLLQEVGDQTIAALQTIKDTEAAGVGIGELLDQGCLTLSQIMAQANNTSVLKVCDDVSTNFGLEYGQATVQQDEEFLFRLGIILFDGVFYVDGSFSNVTGDINNIEILRRLYFSLGKDLDAVSAVLAEKRYQLMLQTPEFFRLPARTLPYTDAEVRTLLSRPFLTANQIARKPDNSVVVYTQKFLLRNTSKNDVSARFGLNSSSLTGYSFNYLAVDNSLGGINKYLNLGLSSAEITSTLGEEDLDLSAPEAISSEIVTAKNIGNQIASSLTFILDRYDSLTDANRTEILNRTKLQISDLQTQHINVLARSQFKVATILQTDTLTRLRTKHTDEKIKYLLENRQEIVGIYFDAPDDLILKILNNTLLNSGPTAVPNAFLNATPPTQTYDFRVLMQMQVYVEEATRELEAGAFRSNLENSRANIFSYLAALPDQAAASTSDTIFGGAVCFSGPSGALLRNMDFNRSFDIKVRLGFIDDAISKLTGLFTDLIAKPLSLIILFLVAIINAINAALDRIIEMAQAVILPLKQKVDAFMSQYMSLIGSGSFDSSLLKCAVNYDIGLSTSLFDDLLALIEQLVTQLRNFLNGLAKLLADLLEKLICIPFNLLNQFLGQAEEAIGLPTSICSFPRVNLGSDLEDALTKLRNAIQIRSVVLGAFSSDLVKFRAIVNGAPNKLNAFRESSICNSNGTRNFFNASILNLGGGFLPNPVGALGNIAGGAGGALGSFF